jgi:hypothetical protein
MKAILSLLFCLTILLGGGSPMVDPAMAMEPKPAPVISLTVTDKPLNEALEAISRDTGFRFNLNGQWRGHPVSAAFTDLPLEKGLKRLLRSLNHTIIWEANRTVTIVVYGKADSGGTGAVSFSAPPNPEPEETELLIEPEEEPDSGRNPSDGDAASQNEGQIQPDDE